MNVQQRSELAGRQTRKQSGRAQYETLRPGDANVGRHSFGRFVQAMDERP